MKRSLSIVFFLVTFAGSAFAQPVEWPISEGGNGHFYQAVPGVFWWQDARAAAASMTWEGLSGHLATVTSEAEHQFIFNTLGPLPGYWLGGRQLAGSPEPAGGWFWITFEPWVYTNWRPGSPSNSGVNENCLQIFQDDTLNRWNDDGGGPNWNHGYLVEYSPEEVPLGPILTVTGDHIDPIQTNVTTTPPTQIELVNGTPVSFCWKADASHYGRNVEGYRYGWDLADPEDDSQWEIPYTPFTDMVECLPDRIFGSGVHTFYIEVVDTDGRKSRASVEITYVRLGPGGSIGIFTDDTGTDCNAYDASPGLMSFYVVHVAHTGANAAWFSAPQPACFSTAIYMDDQAVFPATTGSSQTGVEIRSTRCLSSPAHILTIRYYGQGLTQSCCYYPVLPHPSNGGINVKDCYDSVLVATGGQAIINPMSQCGCNVPVQKATWGRIKALYQ